MSSREIREAFLRHFEARGHVRLPSGPLVPPNDPTLMFANAGMVQFKDVFTGKDPRPYKRAATAQLCIRISGKHNDLENVGVTARHHTFFEMLGNFSFGDYFKKDAIAWAWELVTSTYGLSKEKLVVTVFEGQGAGTPGALPADDEAAAIWAEVTGFGPERILRLGAADNFWSMGETGPCGPCTEMHYWMGTSPPDLSRFGEEPGADGAGWVEIWNNVFMQFERLADGTLVPLPAQSVDTGMGLDRVTAAVQGVVSNYDNDLLRPLVELAAKIAGKTYGGTLEKDDVSMRVIADHARTAAFLVSEGIFPDKEGRSYVLRRVMRRAIRHGHRLGIEHPFLHEVALRVVDVMGDAYPQLVERRALIGDVVRQEEERFRETLVRGEAVIGATWPVRADQHRSGAFEPSSGGASDPHHGTDTVRQELAGSLGAASPTPGSAAMIPGSVPGTPPSTMDGATAFFLTSSLGYPLDLLEVVGQERGFAVDVAGWKAEVQKERERSHGSKLHDGAAVGAVHHAIARDVGATRFTGYESETGRSKIVALVRGGERVTALRAGQTGEVVTAQTPFYGESGGQVGDRGVIRVGGASFEVDDTQKPVEGLVVHAGRMVEGSLEVGAEAELAVDHARRSSTRRNHSATHLLHWALRTVVGPTALQKGSLVGPDRLRFDYSGSRPLEKDELSRIEKLVNDKALLNAPIETEVLPMAEAKRRGAIGIFEEKYGEVVRMLRMTEDSIELCGGTHAQRTGDIGLFKIVSESGVAAGVRRVEAVTGEGAVAWAQAVERELGETAALVRGTPMQAREKVERLLSTLKDKDREIDALKKKLVSGSRGDLTADAREQAGVKVLGAVVDLGDAKALRELSDQLRDKLAPAVILLGTATADGRALLACSVSKDAMGRFAAGSIVKDAAAIVGGGGGGRPDFAQAGGSDPSKLGEAVARVYALVT